MEASRQLPSASSAASLSSLSSPVHRRHARTPASLNSSALASSSSSHNLTHNSRDTFAALGINPSNADPDDLFSSLSIKQLEAFQHAVVQAAERKQSELRALVGERYQDLLGTANTIIGMANSSSQLCEKLSELHEGTQAFDQNAAPQQAKVSRRYSMLSTHAHTSDGLSPKAPQIDEQERIYSLGVSLKLIMDAPEHVWRSIEKGKTLHAAWTFMLARTVWWDFLVNDSASERETTQSIDVRANFPFIEKQWQGLVPMRKQIVQRSVDLLSDTQLGYSAVSDQLCTLVLLDKTSIDKAFSLLLSQRQASLREMLYSQHAPESSTGPNKRRRSSVAFNQTARQFNGLEPGRKSENNSQQATNRAFTAIQQLVRGYSSTILHALRCFYLPGECIRASPDASALSEQPALVATLQTLMQPPALQNPDEPLSSPRLNRRSSLLLSPRLDKVRPPSYQTSAGSSTARRRSSYGLGSLSLPASATPDSASGIELSQAKPKMTTIEVVRSLPSSPLLLRFLPPSALSFTPFVDIETMDRDRLAQVEKELKAWSAKIVEQLASTDSDELGIVSVFDAIDNLGVLAHLRTSIMATCAKCLQTGERKLARYRSDSQGRKETATSLFSAEMKMLQSRLDAILLQRLRGIQDAAIKRFSEQVVTKVTTLLATHSDRQTVFEDKVHRISGSPLQDLFYDEWDKSDSTDVHVTRQHLGHLDILLAGRSPATQKILEPFESSLSLLVEETHSFLAIPGLEANAKESILTGFRGSLHVRMLDLLCLLESKGAKDDQSGHGNKTGLGRLEASVGQTVSLLASSPIVARVFDSDKRLDELRLKAKMIVQSCLAPWHGHFLGSLQASASQEASLPVAMSALLSASDAVFKIGLAIDTNSIVSEALESLGHQNLEAMLDGAKGGQISKMIPNNRLLITSLLKEVDLASTGPPVSETDTQADRIFSLASSRLELFDVAGLMSP